MVPLTMQDMASIQMAMGDERMSDVFTGTRCQRCASRRIQGEDRCVKCDWRFEYPTPQPPEPVLGSQAQPMFVRVVPDPPTRKHVAQWALGFFEVAIVALVVGAIGGWVGATLAVAVSEALSNDPFATVVAVLLWGSTFALLGAYTALRYLAR